MAPVKLIKDKYKIPLIIKGIATAEMRTSRSITAWIGSTCRTTVDATRPWPRSMHVLPEIVNAVAGRAKIMVDGSSAAAPHRQGDCIRR